MTTFVMSDESVNCYGYRVLSSGISLGRFKKNPVMFYGHDSSRLPIGVWENVRVEGGRLMGEPRFDPEDEFAEEVRRKVEEGIVKCCSIGFYIEETDESEEQRLPGQTGPTVTKAELLECSICAIGANRNAMRLSAEGKVEAGRVVMQVMETILKTTDMTEEENKEMERLRAEVSELRGRNAALEAEVSALESTLSAEREERAEGLLTAAVRDGRIGENEKETWRVLLKASPEEACEALKGKPAPGPQTSLARLIAEGKGKGEFSGKSWAELDRAGLLPRYKEQDPAGFSALYAQTFGTDY